LLSGLKKRTLDAGYTLEVSPAAVNHIVEKGYNPEYGARPLKRAIVRELEMPLTDYLLEKENVTSIKADFDPETQKIKFSN
jgi:ATP-dependent Clp protease ATP-binding subunit ClpA